MGLNFEWSGQKATSNLKKHGVSFEEAATAFGDLFSLTIADPDHSDDEDRFVLIGRSFKNRFVVVVHTERGDNIRIISARRATKNEIAKYHQP
jgi:uncharacterized DUF497 family protein